MVAGCRLVGYNGATGGGGVVVRVGEKRKKERERERVIIKINKFKKLLFYFLRKRVKSVFYISYKKQSFGVLIF